MTLPVDLARRYRLAFRKKQESLEARKRARAKAAPIRNNVVFYESYSGNGMTCNPEAIFRHLLKDPSMAHLKHVWALDDLGRHERLIRRYSRFRNVSFVEYNSIQYHVALSTAKYLVNNVTFPNQFSKRDGQVYLNTWHGVPLKKMGYHVEGRVLDAKNIIRNFLACDYLLSAGPEMTERMYLDAFKLANIYQGAIVQEGTPRIDRQSSSARARAEFAERMAQTKVRLTGRKVLLIAPTWKGESYASPDSDVDALRWTLHELHKRIDTHTYQILLKAHQVVADIVAEDQELSSVLVPNDVPTNLVLGATDVLITDYSSIFYDFLATGRPVLFHVPDIDEYRTYRDVYVDVEQFPGPISRSIDELVDNVASVADGRWSVDARVQHLYREARQQYCAREDGQACTRIVDIVFRGNEAGRSVKRGFSDGREKLLIYVGSMKSNGITTSVLNLLDNIDHDRFDVTAMFQYSRDPERLANVDAINKAVRVMPRVGTFNGSKEANAHRIFEQEHGWGPEKRHREDVEALWRDEWRRCFGNATFDRAIEFSGYAPFWSFLFLQGRAKSYSLWLHNDLAADAERTVHGDKPLQHGLYALFQVYSCYDSLISVSRSLAEINAKNLAMWAEPEKFVSCRNTINVSRIRSMAYGVQGCPEQVSEEERMVLPSAAGRSLHEALAVLAHNVPLESLREEVDRMITVRDVIPPVDGVRTFVCVGRLSPEKNHERLVRAYAKVHARDPLTRLVIVGSGPLKSRIASLVRELGLSGSVRMAGHQSNPYLIMARSDCFVMSSDYEGQPMVMLEALTLGLPVVTTAFGSVDDALPKGAGLVVDRSVDALAAGMLRYLSGDVHPGDFDPYQYNERTMEQFYRVIGAASVDGRVLAPGQTSH